MRLFPLLLVFAAMAAPAEARFYGAMYDGEIREADGGEQRRAWGQMRANGVRSARAVFSWAQAQPQEGTDFDFSRSDQVVADSAKRRISLLPVVLETPLWARKKVPNWWPRRASDYAAYVTALVRRYGLGGSFWSENPGVAKRPLRHWQIYNEPGRSKRYVPLLRSAYRAVKAADKRGKVVLGGLTGTAHGTPWGILRAQYKHGARRWFDIAALHMYTGKPANVLEGVKLFRKVMRQRGDRRKPIWLTEFGITASKGRTTAPRSQRTLRTSDRGMATYLRKAYRTLWRSRRKVRLGRAYWYTWASSYERGSGIFRFAGLNRFSDGRMGAKPALKAFRRVARR